MSVKLRLVKVPHFKALPYQANETANINDLLISCAQGYPQIMGITFKGILPHIYEAYTFFNYCTQLQKQTNKPAPYLLMLSTKLSTGCCQIVKDCFAYVILKRDKFYLKNSIKLRLVKVPHFKAPPCQTSETANINGLLISCAQSYPQVLGITLCR
ncbi:MAG: hypothetical protein K5Q00_03200 [Gammaproteobacteria bacterium]|nr:hypothetical protein [Gammaproteobacteria bacterium]MDP3371986.1 hypothetical protein [Candidatus Paracaedibacteraceae bacterium]